MRSLIGETRSLLLLPRQTYDVLLWRRGRRLEQHGRRLDPRKHRAQEKTAPVLHRCSMHVPGNACRDLCLNLITSTDKGGFPYGLLTTVGAGELHHQCLIRPVCVLASCDP